MFLILTEFVFIKHWFENTSTITLCSNVILILQMLKPSELFKVIQFGAKIHIQNSLIPESVLLSNKFNCNASH